MKNNSSQRGFIRTIIIIIIALLILSYFGLNIRTIANSPVGKDNFSYTQEIMISTWNNYLKQPVTYIWDDIFLNLIWNPAIAHISKTNIGGENSLSSTSPSVSDPRSP